MDPITVFVGGAALLYLLGGGKGDSSPNPPPQDPCSPERAAEIIMSGVAGGMQGSQLGPKGAAAGAAAGVVGSLRPNDLACSKQAINAAKARLCANADRVASKLRAKYGATVIPSKWDKFSCDEKLAWLAALGPQGVAAVIAGQLVGNAWNASREEVERWADHASDIVGDSASGARDTVEGWGKKAGKALGL